MNKPSLFIFAIYLMLASCQAIKPRQTPAKSSGGNASSTNMENSSGKSGGSKGKAEEKMPPLEDDYRSTLNFNTGLTVTEATRDQFRFAILLNTEVEYLSNKELYRLIQNWWGTPYKIGGMTPRGIDCSAFVQTVMAGAYEIALPRTAKEQKDMSTAIDLSTLQEGDLVFFNTRGGVSHVGIYLHNNKFVHASTSGGVTISDLAETYWAKRYLGAGRVVK